MGEFSFGLSAGYPWFKALHVISVIAWMAALLYLPRLFHYHQAEFEGSREARIMATFSTMEVRLLRIIGTPAMLAAWAFGIMLLAVPGMIDHSSIWIWVKLASVAVLTWFHFWLAARRKELATGRCRVSSRRFRLLNEIPSILIVIIVIMVIVKPF